MAKKVNVTFVDDLDGESNADETVFFSIDHKDYEIDLSSENAAELRESLEKFVSAGRRVSGGSGRGSKRGTSTASAGGASDKDETKQARLWAVDNGIAVNERGRISADVLEKFRASKAS